MSKKITLPTLHLNGTSAASLLEAHMVAIHALQGALEGLQGVIPNVRDFYPQGPGVYECAALEHAQRVRQLKTMIEELTEIAEHVAIHVGA